MSNIQYQSAREAFAARGVDTEEALKALSQAPVSLHCWQGDDVVGFEASPDDGGSGGIMATGNYLGRARNFSELTADLEQASGIIPGDLRLNLHAIYASDRPERIDRDALTVDHFRSWIDWAREKGWGIDFNPTCFGHAKAASGFTLASPDPGIRQFWVDHCIACRKIAAAIGMELDNPVVTNIWIPDGYKDLPADRGGPRNRLKASLDSILEVDLGDAGGYNIDAVESKLFGIGVESYTVGSHEFYLGYAAQKEIGLCLDAGHFHPTESVADKISAVMLFVPRLLLHVSRGVRWDSDHVVILDDPTRDMLYEVAAGGYLPRTHIGLDFFDASINRIAAWAIGTRNTQKALLLGLLSPRKDLMEAESQGDYTARLALFEDWKSMPWGAVWNEYCDRHETPRDGDWMAEVRDYEEAVLKSRS